MPSLSLCVPREPAQPANVLLYGLRADQPCRHKRGRKPGEPSGRSRASCLRRTQGDQGALGQTTPAVDAESTTVGRSTTARPVVASTGVGERVKYLMIFRSTMTGTLPCATAPSTAKAAEPWCTTYPRQRPSASAGATRPARPAGVSSENWHTVQEKGLRCARHGSRSGIMLRADLLLSIILVFLDAPLPESN